MPEHATHPATPPQTRALPAQTPSWSGHGGALRSAISSVLLSQSLSSPSQTSPIGPVSPAHGPHVPPTHVCVPCTHAPALDPQACVAPSVHVQPSSVDPSQSLSRLSHALSTASYVEP